MAKLFDYVEALSSNKKDLFRQDNGAGYDAYMVNRAFSYHRDTVLYANELNRFAGADKLMQHDFYLHALRRQKRYGGWAKKEKVPDRELIARLLKCNRRMADAYLKILTPEQLAEIRDVYTEGGTAPRDNS